VLVVIVLFVLLGDFRAALVVTFTLPLSIALAGLILKPLGIGINTMTLGGLAIAIGLQVDAAIIMAENIVHRITARRDAAHRRENALAAAIEVGRPIGFATLIVIAVFTPLFAIGGIEGKMYSPLAAAVVSAIAAALVLALTVVPVVSGLFLRPKPVGLEEDVWLIRRLKRVYAPTLDAAMRYAGLVRVGALVVTIPALVLAFYLGSDFMPKLDEGAFLIQTFLPPDASLDEVDRVNHSVEDALRSIPEVEDVSRRTGRAERTEDPMPHTVSDVLVLLKPDQKRSSEEIEQDMRKQERRQDEEVDPVHEAPGEGFEIPRKDRARANLDGDPDRDHVVDDQIGSRIMEIGAKQKEGEDRQIDDSQKTLHPKGANIPSALQPKQPASEALNYR